MQELKEFNFFLETWYKLDYEIKGVNYLRVVDNDNDIYQYELYFYSDYPVYEEVEKYHPLLKKNIIKKKLKNEELFYRVLQYGLNSDIDMSKITTKEVEKFLEKQIIYI